MSPDAGLIDFQMGHWRFVCTVTVEPTVLERSTLKKCEFTRQFEAVNIPDWKLSFSRAFSLMFTTSDRLLLHGDGGLDCTRLTRRCSFHRSKSPGPRPFGLRWCKHPTLSCDLLRQRLREGCLLELAGSDTLAWSEPTKGAGARGHGPQVHQVSYSKQHRDGCKNTTGADIYLVCSSDKFTHVLNHYWL